MRDKKRRTGWNWEVSCNGTAAGKPLGILRSSTKIEQSRINSVLSTYFTFSLLALSTCNLYILQICATGIKSKQDLNLARSMDWMYAESLNTWAMISETLYFSFFVKMSNSKNFKTHAGHCRNDLTGLQKFQSTLSQCQICWNANSIGRLLNSVPGCWLWLLFYAACFRPSSSYSACSFHELESIK